MENIFKEVRNRVSMPDVAKFYGLQINRSGMACCPFHDDKTPSLKIYPDHFHCFGCGESGDGTGFVAKLFRISQFEAAKKISYDFGLNLFNGEIAIPIKRVPNPNDEYLLWLRNAEQTISTYRAKLYEWRKKYAPRKIEEQLNSLFVESLQKTSYIEYLNEILQYGTDIEKRELYKCSREVIQKIERRLEKINPNQNPVRKKAI